MTEIPTWARVAAVVVGTVATSYFTASSASDDKVSDQRFDKVTVTNCQSINDLKIVLKDILRSAPQDPDQPEVSEDYIAAAVAKLETTDCSRLEQP